MSTKLTYTLGGQATLFCLDKHSAEIDALISGKTYSALDSGKTVKKQVLESLYRLTGSEFEYFVGHLFDLVGFTSKVTRLVAEKGVDVVGLLNAEGLVEVTVRVQVKRISNPVGSKDIQALRGALEQGEQGCFVTLSSFSKQATVEAQAPNKTAIMLVDGIDLTNLVLDHFDNLDEDYKKLLGIRRKSKLNVEELFECIQTAE